MSWQLFYAISSMHDSEWSGGGSDQIESTYVI